MTDENKERSYILIEFEEMGSAIFNANYVNIVPGQMLAAGSYLEFEGKNQLSIQRAAQMQSELQKQKMGKVLVPEPKVKL